MFRRRRTPQTPIFTMGAADSRRRRRARRLALTGGLAVALLVAAAALTAPELGEPEAGPSVDRVASRERSVAVADAPPAARFPADPALEAARRYAQERDGEVSFAVVDSRGDLRGADADRSFASASLVKAMLLVAYLDQLEDDGLPIGTEGRALLDSMIRVSDNAAATQVYAAVGGAPALEGVAESAGMDDFAASPAWGESSITAADQARFFARIDRLVPRVHRDYALRLLSSIAPEQSWGIAQAAGDRFEPYFKGGWLPTAGGQLVHQAALLERGGRRLSVAVLTDGSPSFDYGVQTVEGVAERILRPAESSAGAAVSAALGPRAAAADRAAATDRSAR